MSEPIRISKDDIDDPRVDQMLAQEAAIRGAWADEGGGQAVGKVQRAGRGRGSGRGEGLYLGGVIVTALLGVVGALAGWAAFEPFIEEGDETGFQALLAFLMIPAIVTGVGTLVSVSDGLLSRAWSRAATTAGIALGLGIVGGAVFTFVANFIFGVSIFGFIAFASSVKPGALRHLGPDAQTSDLPTFMILGVMSIRSMAWSVFGIPLGLAPGLAQRSRDLLMVGVLGGVLGGFLGGLFFEPISVLFGGQEATLSRAVGFGFVGLVTGLSIGLVEQLSKDAWLYMEEGPLAGKQFVLYKDPTRVGSSPKCDVFIFKDPDVKPEHAVLRRGGATHEVEALGDAVVLVNGKRVGRQRLEDGDEVRVGRARFRYYVRDRRKKVR